MSDLSPTATRRGPLLSADERLLILLRWLGLAFLAIAFLAPVALILGRAMQDMEGDFTGLANIIALLESPALARSVWNSVWTGAVTVLIVVPLAFIQAYALTRAHIPGKRFFRAVMLVPILAPSLLPALALIYLFGNQGLLKPLLLGGSIYGPGGIVIAQCFYTFPHAALILGVALSHADARLYEAADVLKAGPWRRFATITLPSAGYGLVAAAMVVFALVVTDFGIPKVIGGQFDVLATDVYKQVVGLQDVNMGATVGLALLLPAFAAFLAESWTRRRRTGTLSGRAVPLTPRPRPARDVPLFLACAAIAGLLLAITGVAFWGSLVRYWPWNLELTFESYDFARFDADGWGAVWTSLRLATGAALLGTPVVFIIAYAIERGPAGSRLRPLLSLIATLPLAIPGLVLGLGYILFFNHPANPLNLLYGSLALLMLNCVTHFYSVAHLTASTAIRRLDPEFEAVGASLKVPLWRTFGLVTLPICLPAILDIAVYLFVNAMTTVSAVIFLYGPGTKPASVAVLQMDEAGQASAAAAMACTILAVTSAVKILQVAASGLVDRLTQGWRQRRTA
ncbi:putative 2-aminoethylphosphonate ABC transporter permease subunit [Acetobacteraceae bacterium H6797]|nr:putative 2-aminoethylphosphonate ABC transporter permease subunit [Acetobacteraceae bacterium H6797]